MWFLVTGSATTSYLFSNQETNLPLKTIVLSHYYVCNVSKVLERLVYNKILDFYSDSISCHQFGFCKNKSTLQQLLLYFDDLCSDREQIDSIYLDFSKAFDSVSHTKLLLKLWSVGITGGIWSWIQSYLSDRSQCVLVNSCLSLVWCPSG